ncbi:MAG: ATP-binding protein [archaeon]
MRIKNKINISFTATFILVVSLVALIIGIYVTGTIKKNIFAYINSSNIAKAEHTRMFIQDQERMAVVLAAASVYRDFLKEPDKSSQYQTIKDKIYKRFTRTQEADPQIYEIFIINANGNIEASSNKINEGLDKSEDPYFAEAKNDVFLKDIYFSETIKKINYTISAPIKDDNGDLLGVSVLRYFPDNLFMIVKDDNKIANSEENFLINKEKFFITPSKFLGEGVVLKQKVETENANDCFDKNEMEYVKKNGYTGISEVFGSQISEAKDYRNIDVIATHAYIPETGWCLITKADKNDLLSFRVGLVITLVLIFAVAELLFLLIGFFVSRKITNPIKILQMGIEKIKQGNFDFKLNIKTKDEIGNLSSAFDIMTTAVKESILNINKKVEDKTKGLVFKSKEIEDQKLAILNILEDVEKEKSKAESLAEDLEKFKLAVDNVSDHIVITDQDGIVIYANRAVETITGFRLEEAIGKKAGSLWKLPMPLEYYKNLWNVIKDQKKVFTSEIQNKRKSGEIYTAIISISSVLNDKGDILYFVAVERDITKEKEIDKAKTELISLASHQLRTPLSSINWYAEMLLAGDAGVISDEQKKYITEIAIGNKRMVDLVDDLLNVSRLDMGTFKVEAKLVNVLELVKSVLSESKPDILTKKLVIEEIYGKDIPEFSADEKLLRMIFQNLVSNAVKYTPPSGTIKISILKFNFNNINNGEDFGGKRINEESLVFSVSDTGMGIPANQQDKIFSKLFRADNAKELETEGTGLGLYVVKSIINQSSGLVWFKSEESKGTTFYVAFPISGMKIKNQDKKLISNSL